MNFATMIADWIGKKLVKTPQLNSIQEALGRIEAILNSSRLASNPRDYEFKVYSQWGEDGIIDHLITRLAITNRSFIEFGVESYTEANTLFLLKHRHWSGLVIDGSAEHVNAIKRREEYWRYALRADASFVTRDNINEIIARNGFAGDLGLLSIDIDGNDYWVWQAIDCVNPAIVIAEYNSLFGPTARVTIPYQADFIRHHADSSNMYYGASIAALEYLARSKGYSLVAGNSAGNNVFFVRDNLLGALKRLSPQEAYVQAAFREALSPDREVLYINFAERQAAIAHKTLVDVASGEVVTLKDVLRLGEPAAVAAAQR
jgi:hypothetical protein